jgi:hypothetical protein
MSYKLKPRLGSAIASTILSLFSAVSLVEVDQAQAAVLTYKTGFDERNYFKVDTSLLTGIRNEGYESIAVSEGRLYDFTLGVVPGAKTYYDLAGATARFFEGDFRGLIASGRDDVALEYISTPDEPGAPYYWVEERFSYWDINYTSIFVYSNISRTYFNYQSYIDGSLIQEYYEPYFSGGGTLDLSYTLVDTQPSPVPEPLTAGGTALALAGLSWLKHKKKMAA